MYQLGRVRVLSVGPPGRRFADECLEFGTNGGPDLIVGRVGAGKTIFAELVHFVLAPCEGENSTRLRLPPCFPDSGVGHVLHEWRDRNSGQSVVLGLAAVRRHDRLVCSRYAVRLRPGLELCSLPLAEHSSSLEETHRCVVDAADAGDAPFITAKTEEWRARLASFGLGADSIYLAGDGIAKRRRMADPAAFVEEAGQRLTPAIVPELAAADRADLDAGQIAVLLLPAAKTLLRCLRAVEELSTVSTGSSGAQRPLIRIRFADPGEEVLSEQLLALARGKAPRKLHAAVAAAIRDTADISVLVDPDRQPRYVSLARWESSTSSLTQEITAVLLNAVFARVRASVGGAGVEPVVAFIDLPMAVTMSQPEVEILRSWGQRIVYLSTDHAWGNREFLPAGAGRIYDIVDADLRDDGGRVSRIVSPVALASVSADRADRQDFEPLTEVFDVLDPADDGWKDGDLIVPHHRWGGTSNNVQIASATEPPGAAYFVILRPRQPLPPGAALLYSRYLGGDAILSGEAISRRQRITVSYDDLAGLLVPRLDQPTLRAIADLTGAAADFEQWHRETVTAVDSFLQWQNVSAARADIIAAGRLTRQRWEAAQVLDVFTSRVRTTLPYPIASRWRSLEAARLDEAGYRAILDCAETVVTYSAALGVQFAWAHQVTLPKLRALSSKLRQGVPIPFGIWTVVLADLADVASAAHIPVDSPLRNFAWFGGDVYEAVAALKARRNALAHGRVPAPHAFAPLCAAARAELEELVAAAEWLADYPLRHVDEARWNSFTDSTQVAFRELMGDHSVVGQRRDTTQGNVELFSPYAVDQFGRYYLLRPLLHTALCDSCGQLSVFVLDRWIPAQHRAEFKALNHGDVCQVSCEHALRSVGLLPA